MTDTLAARLRAVPSDTMPPKSTNGNGNGHHAADALPFIEYVLDEKTGKTRTVFHIDRLGEKLVAETPFANGGNRFYVYRNGVYTPGGERDVRRGVREALGEHWRPMRSNDVLRWICDDLPDLDETPPLDRINVKNGILQLSPDGKTWNLTPHDPSLLSPVRINVTYDPHATCPQIDTFVAAVLPGHEQIVHELAGYLITPDNRYQKAVMCLGPGGGGKSKFIGLLNRFIGEGNVSHVALHQLEEDRFATADLYGQLLNTFADLDSRALKASSIFKSITGDDPIRAERKGRDSFTYKSYSRLCFSTNEAPPTSDSSTAFFDRWLVLSFSRAFRGRDLAERDEDILEKITTERELSGFLNHALLGHARLHAQRRFSTTAVMDDALERFKVDSDSVAGFIEEGVTVGEGRTSLPTLYQSYRVWCELAGRRPLAAVRVNRRIGELLGSATLRVTVRGVDYWDGIRLNHAGDGAE